MLTLIALHNCEEINSDGGLLEAEQLPFVALNYYSELNTEVRIVRVGDGTVPSVPLLPLRTWRIFTLCQLVSCVLLAGG